nr:hypothetical protein [uncultured Bacteroides sp.]
MGEKEENLEKKMDRLAEGMNDLRKDLSEVKLVLEGSPLGAQGMAKRFSELERKVTRIEVLSWKAIGIASVVLPILMYLIQKYL